MCSDTIGCITGTKVHKMFQTNGDVKGCNFNDADGFFTNVLFSPSGGVIDGLIVGARDLKGSSLSDSAMLFFKNYTLAAKDPKQQGLMDFSIVEAAIFSLAFPYSICAFIATFRNGKHSKLGCHG